MIDYFAETFSSERTNGTKGEMKRFSINNKKGEEKINKKIKFIATNMKKMENQKEFVCFIEGIIISYSKSILMWSIFNFNYGIKSTWLTKISRLITYFGRVHLTE